MAHPRDQVPVTLCDELAELLGRPDALRTARLLQAAELLRETETPEASSGPDEAPTEEHAAEPIGIWEPVEVEGRVEFVRPPPEEPDDDMWPHTPRLVPKTSPLPLKVAFLGESAAAGLYYAPRFSPADVLQQQLDAVRPGLFEVVNLTHQGLQPQPLVLLAMGASQLRPDVIVSMAGNNWTSSIYPQRDVAASMAEGARLRTGGIAGLARSSEEATAALSKLAMDNLATIQRSTGIPVVTVVPEVNLIDWVSAHPVGWLPGSATTAWWQAFHRTRTELDAGDAAAAARTAAEMVALDGGSCPTSHRLRALAELRQDHPDAAFEALLADNDASVWHDYFGFIPRTTRVIREAQLEGAGAMQGALVDLREVFRTHLGTPFAGRRLFLDYCHFTLEGMKVAMAAVTAAVLRVTGAVEQDLDVTRLLRELPEPACPPAVDARAKLLTAVATAHLYGVLGLRDEEDLVTYWLEQAVNAYGGVLHTMKDLATARMAPLPPALTVARQRVDASEVTVPARLWAPIHARAPGTRLELAFVDGRVFEALCSVLEKAGRGARAELDALAVRYHGARQRPLDLASPAYRSRIWSEYGSQHTDLSLYRSIWHRAEFHLAADGRGDVGLELTARLPAVEGARQGTAQLSVNGASLGEVRLSERWSKHALRIPARTLRSGFNTVAVAWPLPGDGTAPLRHAVERLEQGLPAHLVPVMGEVFSLLARRL
ncbi:MAG: hypothetical protein IT371_22270 [Deltaproteobacteria bacterium]|nr:hypothetical protein [Deltaproteobacteria bacterium]